MKKYLAHVISDDGYEHDLEVYADDPKGAAEAGFWEALERCLSPASVTAVTEYM